VKDSAEPRVVSGVTEDGPALFFPPGSLGSGGGIEKGTLYVEKAPSRRTRIVGYRDEPRGVEPHVSPPATAPRSRPREHRAARASDSGGGSRGGDSGDHEPPLADLAGGEPASRRGLPALVVRLPLEGRLEARLEGPAGNLRLDDWFRASRVLLEVAAFALELDRALAHVDEEADC
jgi:hypothetical protein